MAQAGVFTDIAAILENEAKTAPAAVIMAEKPTVAATEPVLRASLRPEKKPSIGGGDIFVRNGVLVSPGPVSRDAIAPVSTGEISVYVVREGDSLSQIAEMYGVTTNTILWANDIKSANTIQPGDTLVILPIVGVQHTVANGDTINSIAKEYEGDVDEILSYNQLASADELSVGDTLTIPGGEVDTPVVAAVPTRSSGSNSAGSASFTHPLPGATRTQGVHGYNAVDLAFAGGGVGTPIRAAAAGEVIVSKSGSWNGGYGNYVVIRHAGGVQTLYAHNSSNAVSVGSWVAQGQTIGYVGNTGRSTGAHLHFEVRGARNPF